MIEEKRYEIKFVLNTEEAYTKAKNWLFSNTLFKKSFPNRKVNSLYFDDINFSSAKDNLVGIPDRNKIRLRWYDNSKNVVLENKIKESRLGYKVKYNINEIEASYLKHMHKNEILKVLNSSLLKQNFYINSLEPNIYIQYVREYYEDFHNIRVTFDRNITYSLISNNRKLESLSQVNDYRTIMEIKFDQDNKDRVSKLIKNLNLSPVRNSKYLNGLSHFGLAVYI